MSLPMVASFLAAAAFGVTTARLLRSYEAWLCRRRQLQTLAVVRVLMDSPDGAYGLDIVKGSAGIIRRGRVYVLLAKLEEEGLVTRHGTEAAFNRPIFRLTPKGEQLFAFMFGALLRGRR